MGKLIKPPEREHVSQGLQTYNMSDLQLELDNMIKRARRQAAVTLKRAKVEAEALRDQIIADSEKRGFEDGFAKGLEQGKQDGLKQVLEETRERAEPLINELQEMIGKFSDERKVLREKATAECLEFALQVAEMIVRTEIQLHPDVLFRNIEAAIDLTLKKTDLEITVNPDDMDMMEEFVEDIQDRFTEVEGLSLIGDPSIERGGCLVSSPEGKVDASIATQLEEIRNELLKRN